MTGHTSVPLDGFMVCTGRYLPVYHVVMYQNYDVMIVSC